MSYVSFYHWRQLKMTFNGLLPTDDCFALLLSRRWMFPSYTCMLVFASVTQTLTFHL